jgi:hypothetical protein
MEEVTSDWAKCAGTLENYVDYYSFTEDWEIYFWNEGLIHVEYSQGKPKCDENGKYITTLDSSGFRNAVEEVKSKIESELIKEEVIVNIYNSYEYNGLNDIKPSMIAESLENARNAADEFAKNSRSRIGKMRTASQGYFEVEDLDENTPQIKKIRVVTTVEYYLK